MVQSIAARVSLLFGLFVLAGLACDKGGPHLVVRNNTDITLSVIFSGDGAPPNWPLGELAPGSQESFTTYSNNTRNFRDKIEAWDEQERLVYCRMYGPQDIRDGQVEIVIVAGEITCPSPPVKKPTRPPYS